ncbi:MAG: hypothetical protein AABY74_11640 [Planctomycetota bacterium]
MSFLVGRPFRVISGCIPWYVFRLRTRGFIPRWECIPNPIAGHEAGATNAVAVGDIKAYLRAHNNARIAWRATTLPSEKDETSARSVTSPSDTF